MNYTKIIHLKQGIWQSAMVRFRTIGKNPHYLWKTTDISIELQSKRLWILIQLILRSQDDIMLWTTNIYLCAPVYNAHPHFEACFHKRAFQRHSCRKIIFWKNSTEISNLAIPARKPVTGVDANHLMFCLFSDTSCFMMFSSAVLLLHDRTRSICTTPVTFLWTRSPGTRLAATW